MATDALIEYVNDERVYRLAQALEEAVGAVADYDAMIEKVTEQDEEIADLDVEVKDLKDSIRDVWRVSKSAKSSDVKRLAEIQGICEEAMTDTDLAVI